MKQLLSSYFQNYAGFSKNTWILLLTIFINTLGGVVTVFLSLYLINELHFNVMQAGIIITSIGVGGMFGSYIGGTLCDKISELHICISSLIINATGLFLLIFPTKFIPFVLIAVILGLSNSAFAPANRILLMKYAAQEDQYRVNNFRYMLLNFGFGLGVLICGFLSDISYHLIFIFNSLATLGAAAFLFFHSFSMKKEKKEIENSSEPEHVHRPAFKANINWLYLTLLFGALIFSQLRATYPIYSDLHYHMDADLFSYLFLINTACIVILQVPLLSFLKRRIHYLNITGSGIFFIGLGMFLLPFGNTYSFAIIACLVWTAGEILFFSTIQLLVYERATEYGKGKAMGIYQMITTFGNMLGPFAGSWLYHFYDGKILWYCCGLLGSISLCIYLAIYFRQSSYTNAKH